MRIVFDSNIYISAFLRPSGRASIAFESAQKGHFLLFCSPDIVKEVAGKLRSKFLWEEMRTQSVIKRIVKASVKISQPQGKDISSFDIALQKRYDVINASEKDKCE